MQVNLGFTSSLKKWFSKVILCTPWLCCLDSRNVEQAGVTDFYHAVVALLTGRCHTASQNFPHFSKVRNHRLSGLWGQREKKKTMSPIHSYKSSSSFSRSVVSNSLRPHGFQHARLPCPSPSPRACSNFYVHWVSDAIQPYHQFSSVQSLSCVRLFATPWIAACQASLSITNSWSLLKLRSIESVMPSSHLILCCPLLLLPPTFPSIRLFSSESTLHTRWPKYWSFSFSISPSNEHPGLISFRMDWLDLLAEIVYFPG